MRSYLRSLTLLIGMITLASCQFVEPLVDKFVVRFVSDKGYAISDRLIASGELIEEPLQEDPGFAFHGWYQNSNPGDFDIPWDFLEDRVYQHTTLYAKWTGKPYVINFFSEDGTQFEPLEIIFGEPFTLPEPTRFGYTFGGWYLDPMLSQIFNQQTMEPKDTLLYANWLAFPTLDILLHEQDMVTLLSDYGNQFSNTNPVVVKTNLCPNQCNDLDALEALLASNQGPALFQLPIQGQNLTALLERFSPYMLDLTFEPWEEFTDVGLRYDRKLVGFPLSLHGAGLAYNIDIIDRYNNLANVDRITPGTLTNYENLLKAVIGLHNRRQALNIQSVFALGSNAPISYLFNAYLASGKTALDFSVLYDLQLGNTPPYRVDEYVNWLTLLSDFSLPQLLSGGGETDQIRSFTTQQSVFLPYSSGLDDALIAQPVFFRRGYVPLGQFTDHNRGVAVHTKGSWVFVNRNVAPALIPEVRKLLSEYTTSNFIQNRLIFSLGRIPAFRRPVGLTSLNPLHQSVITYYQGSQTQPYLYHWIQPQASGSLTQIHQQYFRKTINRSQFTTQLRQWIQNYPQSG
jgi:uncharacterized repeat protein (TIGR02543 family)